MTDPLSKNRAPATMRWWEKPLSYINRNSLRMQMVLFNLLIMLTPLVIIQIVFSNVYYSYVEKNVTNTYTMIFNQVRGRLTEYVRGLDGASTTLFLNADFQDDLISLQQNPSIDSRRKMNNRLAGYSLINAEITGASVYAHKDFTYQYSFSFSSIPTEVISRAIEYVDPVRGRPYKLHITFAFDKDNRIYDEFLAIRLIKGIKSSFPDIAYGVLSVNRSSLGKMLETDNTIDNARCFIVDDSGIIVAATQDDEYAGLNASSILPAPKDGEVLFMGEPYIYKSAEFQDLGWQMIAIIPKSTLYKSGNEFQLLLLIVTIGSIFLGVMVTLSVNLRITYPLKHLSEGIRRLAKGDMKAKVVFGKQNEITIIADKFNEMVDSIETLTRRNLETQKKLYEIELEKTRFELTGLQSQINSHFLYNTLNTIRGMVMLNNTSTIIDNLEKLISFLRYSASNAIYVTINEEIEHLKNYLSIQNARFGDRFTLVIDVENSLLHHKILKLTLQPLIENAIKHAFGSTTKPGIIQLQIKRQHDIVDIRLLDNGVGIDAARLSELQAQLAKRIDFGLNAKNDIKPGNIGLINIHRRLRIFYGDAFGVAIHSWENRGTVVHIRIPAD